MANHELLKAEREELKQRLNVRTKRIALIAEAAEMAFCDHQITQRLDQGMFRSWRCQRPGSWNLGFDVTTTPGALIVSGDLGTLVVERCEDMEDMIAWARGAIGDIHYFASKVSREIPTEGFDLEAAREAVREGLKEAIADGYDRERIGRWRSLLGELSGMDASEPNEWEVEKKIFCSGLYDGVDWPNCRNWRSRFLWQREALKWFLAHLPTQRE